MDASDAANKHELLLRWNGVKSYRTADTIPVAHSTGVWRHWTVAANLQSDRVRQSMRQQSRSTTSTYITHTAKHRIHCY